MLFEVVTARKRLLSVSFTVHDRAENLRAIFMLLMIVPVKIRRCSEAKMTLVASERFVGCIVCCKLIACFGTLYADRN